MELELFCPRPFTRCRLTSDGHVLMCGFQDKSIGRLLEGTFDDVWFGEAAEQVRTETIEGRLHKLCQTARCPYLNHRTNQRVTYNEYPTFLEIELPFESKSESAISRLANIVPNLQQIDVYGEPFENDVLFEAFEALRLSEYRNDITVSVTTNGLGLDADCRRAYLTLCPKSVTVFTSHVHLKEFCQERQEDQHVRMLHHINVLNVEDVVAMVELAVAAGADEMEFDPTTSSADLLANESNCGKFKRAHLDIIEVCNRLDVPVSFVKPLDLGLTEQLMNITL